MYLKKAIIEMTDRIAMVTTASEIKAITQFSILSSIKMVNKIYI